MKKLLSLLLAVALLVSCATLTFAAEETVANDFVGVINLYTSADPQPAAANTSTGETETPTDYCD